MKNRLNALQKELKRIAPAHSKSQSRPYMFGKNEIVVSFKDGVNQTAVSDYSLEVIKDTLRAARLTTATISSTTRTAEDQAAIMYRNIENYGVENQLKLYGAGGDRVINVYVRLKAQGKSKSEIIGGMLAEIYAIGPSKVSRHVGDPTKVNIIDIAPSSITDKAAFEAATKAESRISRYFFPPIDPAYHIEIPQNIGTAQSIRLRQHSILSNGLSHGSYYDDARAIDLSFDSESIPIDPEALAADQEDFFAPPSDTTEAKGSFELVNNEYVYKDDSKSSTSPRATISKVDNSQFADLKPKTAPQDEADRAMLRADKALANELSDAMDFDQFEDETVAPEVEAKSKEELDFAKDLQAILSGEKIYDPESKDLVEHKREVTLDGEESEATPTETHKPKQSTEQEALKANNSSDPYDIFNQIENNRGTREVINSESEELSVFDEVPPMVSAHSKNTIVNIEVLEQTTAGMDNGFLPQRATAVEGELRASSVSDMVQKVLAHLKDGQKIGRLIISGHGAKGNISVGAGQGSINGKEINGDSKHWKTELAKLKDKFDPNKGELFLRGCNVGAGQAGSRKLQELANFLNIRVFAPTGKVYHSKEEVGSVHQVAKPGASAPAPIGTPSEVKIAEKSRAHTLDNSGMLFKDLEEIKFYTEHYIDKGISAKDADVVETASSWIKGFQTQLTVSDPDQLKGLAAKINGVVFLTRGGNQQKLLIYDDFHHLVDEDFSLSYELSPILRAQIIEVFQPNLSLMSSMPEALGTKTEVDITIIDHNNDGFLGGSALLTLGELRGASVKDSIDKILGHLEEGQKIRKLTIIGHGNKGLIIMGSAKKREKDKHLHGATTDWHKEIARLNGHFTEDGEIILRGCNTGAGELGSLLLKQVADLTGAKVSAPTGKVYSASDESGTMYPVAHPNQPAPKPRLTPSEAKGEGFSIAQTIDTMKQESIKQITIHLADENEFPSNPAQYSVKENDPGFIKQFVNGINFGAVEDASQLGSIIDAQLAVSSDQGTKTYQLFGDFRLIAIADDWSKTYPISNVLRDAIMQRLNIGNQQAPMA